MVLFDLTDEIVACLGVRKVPITTSVTGPGAFPGLKGVGSFAIAGATIAIPIVTVKVR